VDQEFLLFCATAAAVVNCLLWTVLEGCLQAGRADTYADPQQRNTTTETAVSCLCCHVLSCSLTQYSHDPEGGWGAALAHHLQRRVSGAAGQCVWVWMHG
jgi:hypothetical protein